MRPYRDRGPNLSSPSLFRGAARQSHRTNGAVGVALALVAVGFITLSRVEHSALTRLRAAIGDVATPALSLIVKAAAPLRTAGPDLTGAWGRMLRPQGYDEVARLRAENAKLVGLVARLSELERENTALAALAKVPVSGPEPVLAARVVTTAITPFGHTLLVAAGDTEGVKYNQPVTGALGLVGRVMETTARQARVLLLSDPASRVPVAIGTARARAVMVGDTSPEPRLEFVGGDGALTAGVPVVTSGVGGLYPRGLLVGTLTGAAGNWRVGLASTENMDVVRVHLTNPPAIDPDPSSRGRPPSLKQARARPGEEGR